jgi:hypothetical protein
MYRPRVSLINCEIRLYLSLLLHGMQASQSRYIIWPSFMEKFGPYRRIMALKYDTGFIMKTNFSCSFICSSHSLFFVVTFRRYRVRWSFSSFPVHLCVKSRIVLKVKEGETGRACSTNGGEEECI